MSCIVDIINEIKNASIENPQSLFARLIQERLQLALKSYYTDLINKSNTFENQAETNTIRVMRKLIK